ncbi:MAG: DUF1697 domain-containing protein [Chloroflexota bacterium]|nr:DUF1697 domain-containing protein [Chloroflexota bacterium]
MTTFVALFRAINVGGHNRVAMAALKNMFEGLGLRGVSTYLQTGNVIFESAETAPLSLTEQLGKEFEQKFGFYADVIVRTSAELKEVVDKNPFLNHPEKETKWLVVMFLASCPTEQAKKELLSTYEGPEELFITTGDQSTNLYIYYTNGIGRSKLSNVFLEKKLKVQGTARNWNTITKLLEIAQA